tara:strand:- start:233 stop:520 length:288 start_codon:yes stop_codon:yes gene_type:complete
MDYGLAVGILLFIEGLVILKGLVELSKQIEQGLDDLDMTLAEAIQNVVSGFGQMEQTSPIQNALAQILMNSVAPNQPSSVVEVLQGDDGKFLKKE